MFSLRAGSVAFCMAALTAGPLLAQANEALVAAVEAGDLYRLQVALTAGAEVNACNERGHTVLSLSLARPELVRALLAAKADVNLKTESGFTPLQLAAMAGQLEAARLLLAAGADLHATGTGPRRTVPSRSWSTPSSPQSTLHPGSPPALPPATPLAPRPASKPVGGFTMRGSSFLESTYARYEALGLAAALGGQADLVSLLLAAGADPNARTKEGLTPLLLLAQHGLTPEARIDELLVMRGLRAEHRLDREHEISRLLINEDPDPNTSRFSDPGVIAQILIQAGADPGATPRPSGEQNSAGVPGDWTALMVAARRGLPGLVAALIGAKVDVNAGTPVNRENAIGAAAGYPGQDSEAHSRIIRMLVAAGAELEKPFSNFCTDLANGQTTTPLMVAALAGNVLAARTLIALGAKVDATVSGLGVVPARLDPQVRTPGGLSHTSYYRFQGKTALYLVVETWTRKPSASTNGTALPLPMALAARQEDRQRRQMEMLRLLLAAKANPQAALNAEILPGSGFHQDLGTPLAMAEALGDQEVINQLRSFIVE